MYRNSFNREADGGYARCILGLTEVVWNVRVISFASTAAFYSQYLTPKKANQENTIQKSLS